MSSGPVQRSRRKEFEDFLAAVIEMDDQSAQAAVADLCEKTQVELRETKARFMAAKVKARAEYRFLPPEEFSRWSTKVSRLSAEHQKLLHLRGDISRRLKEAQKAKHCEGQKEFYRHFYDVARERLTGAMMDEFKREADARLRGDSLAKESA